MGCAYTGRGGGPMRTETPTETCPNDAAENVITRMLNKAQRTMDRFIWPFPGACPRPNGSLACVHSLCRKTLRRASLRSSHINPGLPGMLRQYLAENREFTRGQEMRNANRA